MNGIHQLIGHVQHKKTSFKAAGYAQLALSETFGSYWGEHCDSKSQ